MASVDARCARPASWLAGGIDAGSDKRWYDGTHRVRTPAETLALVAPHLVDLGITRIADIDGLDPLGVPVAMATRPLSRSLAVSQGKGLSRTAARVSAIMEAIENRCAERILAPLRLGSETELRRAHREDPTSPAPVDAGRLPRSVERDYLPTANLLWIEGHELVSNQPRLVPLECVHTDFRVPRPAGHGFFPGDSNGLASGNNRGEALVHALSELVERDALHLWRRAAWPARARIDPTTLTEPGHGLLSTLERHGVRAHLLDVTSDIGVACIQCLLEGDRRVDPELGAGCHPDRNVALVRAVTEAVQARVTFVAGSRDDFGREPYTDDARETRRRQADALLDRLSRLPSVDFAAVPGQRYRRVDDDLEWLLERLVACDIDEIVAIDLTTRGLPVSVVRAVAVGLEGADTPDTRPGMRARDADRRLAFAS